jgi:hypothetical protein
VSCLPDSSNTRFKVIADKPLHRRAVNVKAEGVRQPYPAAGLPNLLLEQDFA